LERVQMPLFRPPRPFLTWTFEAFFFTTSLLVIAVSDVNHRLTNGIVENLHGAVLLF
jgi:hypothetical protein